MTDNIQKHKTKHRIVKKIKRKMKRKPVLRIALFILAVFISSYLFYKYFAPMLFDSE